MYDENSLDDEMPDEGDGFEDDYDEEDIPGSELDDEGDETEEDEDIGWGAW